MIRHARLAPGPVATTATMRPGGACAIALFLIVGDDADELDAWLARTGLGPIAPGRTRLVDALGIDEAVLARPTARTLHLMPHGGPACVHGLAAALDASGASGTTIGAIEPQLLYPAARTPRQALAMALLALAASPLAIDVLAWQGAMDEPGDNDTDPNTDPNPAASSNPAPGSNSNSSPEAALPLDAAPLRHLLFPPTVAIVGGANIGKSTLLNALARRQAAIVADEPGTTRDHLGVSLVLDGLAVRWLDTPGLRHLDPTNSPADAVEAAARATADRAVANADLILLAADHNGPFPHWPHAGAPERTLTPTPTPTLRLRLRCDRTKHPPEPGPDDAAIHLAIPHAPGPPTGLAALARAVRSAFVPDRWLARARREPMALSASASASGFARGAAPR